MAPALKSRGWALLIQVPGSAGDVQDVAHREIHAGLSEIPRETPNAAFVAGAALGLAKGVEA